MDLPLFQKWLEDKGTLSESTIYVYTRSIGRFLSNDPDIDDLDTYNNFMIKVAIKKRCSHYYSAIKAFIQFKVSDSTTKSKLIEGLLKPKERQDIVRERKYLKIEKIIEIINNLQEDKHKVIALIQHLSGVRAGDILGLKTGNIITEDYKNIPTMKLNVHGKRRKRNVIYIHNKIAQDIIWDYLSLHDSRYDIEGYYFLQMGRNSKRPGNVNSENDLMKMNYFWYWNDLKQALQTSQVDKHDWATHDLRRCYARRVWDKYKDIHVLQGLLNHSDPKTTLKYLDQSGLKNIDYHYEMQQ